jgi:hypothetical protein
LESYTFDGTEIWTKRDTNVSGKSFYTTTLPIKAYANNVIPNLLCADYLPVTYLDTFRCVNGCGSTEGLLSVYDSAHDNISRSEFSAFMAGKTITFELATPSPDTYVDPILDNLIKTEAGGTIESILTNPVDDSMTLGYINL